MRIPAKLYEVMSCETDRLLDRLNEAIALDFTNARDNGPSLHPSPDVVRATADAHDEFERLLDRLRDAGGERFLGNRKPLEPGASLSVVYTRAMPLVRRITHMLRDAVPQIEEDSFSSAA